MNSPINSKTRWAIGFTAITVLTDQMLPVWPLDGSGLWTYSVRLAGLALCISALFLLCPALIVVRSAPQPAPASIR